MARGSRTDPTTLPRPPGVGDSGAGTSIRQEALSTRRLARRPFAVPQNWTRRERIVVSGRTAMGRWVLPVDRYSYVAS
ncbi:MAG: hypothetical protein WB789_08665 [Thermoplasmata archaeon]